MKVSLVVVKGKREGKVLPITVPQFVIGRHKECQLRASGSTISQHHCAILVKKDRVFVHDFDSTNGTFVNHHRVQGEQELGSDDLLELGRLAFRMRIEVDAEDEEAPESTPKSDESFIGEMLLNTSEAEGGFLGLMDDSTCGSTIMRKPDLPEGEPKDSAPEEAEKAAPPAIESEKGNTEEESPSLRAGASDEVAKKLLEEFHRSVYAKHNPRS
jgi:pSer/pThr/pTyr-binding forkhead associated (FHA) protein